MSVKAKENIAFRQERWVTLSGDFKMIFVSAEKFGVVSRSRHSCPVHRLNITTDPCDTVDAVRPDSLDDLPSMMLDMPDVVQV